MRTLISLVLVLANSFCFADVTREALLASVQGDAQVLSPGPDENGKALLTYEGAKYHFAKAKIGQKVKTGQIVMTSTDGKVKLIFDHGDIVIVGPSSALSIPGKATKTAMNGEINLRYGKMRAIVDKDGPLSGVKIRTPVAVAGVRGTDLYVTYNMGEEQTEVQVLRGEVEVKPATTLKNMLPEKPVIIKLGEVGKIDIHKDYQVKTSTKDDLAKVQENTTVIKPADVVLSEPTQKVIAVAEQKAVENIIKDVRRYDPQAGQKLLDTKVSNVEDANTICLHEVYKTAPMNPTKQKPNLKDFDEKSEDVYQKYFKPLNL
jgi:hypothetical protein